MKKISDTGFNSNNLIFSFISGYNYYIITDWKDDNLCDAYHCVDETEVNIVFKDITLKQDKWKQYIEYPPDVEMLEWPVDIVVRYEERSERIGLVFRKKAYPKLTSIKKILYNDLLLDWRKDNIRTIINNFLTKMDSIDKCGYFYHDFNLQKIKYDDNYRIFIPFNLSITRSNEQNNYKERIDKKELSIECIPPWIDWNEEETYMGRECAYYSIAVILFRLMIGRMPYQGRFMDDWGGIMNELKDTDETIHIQMFKEYIKQSVFIFEENSLNSIGDITYEEKFVERWEQLPHDMQKMFIEVFSHKNIISKETERVVYSPEEWLNIINSQCYKLGGK